MSEYIKKYNIPTYSAGTTYTKHDVVKVAVSDYEYYFVAARSNNVGQLNTSTYVSNSWWKRFDDYEVSFSDVWEPTYSTSADVTPRIASSVLEDGMTLIRRDGIHSVPLSFNLVFESVTDREAKSLLCFFEYLGGKRSFKWTTPAPYEKSLFFNLVNLRHSYQTKDVNNVNIGIKQSFVIFGVGAGQEKF